jgi:pimeloyl-ACP methyl ester carboxylesterase
MRRFLLSVLLCVTLVGVAACSGTSSEETTTSGARETGQVAETTAVTTEAPSDPGESSTTTTGAVVTTAANATTAAALQETRSLDYTVEGDTQLDVFAPLEPGPWPVVVVIPGSFQEKSAYEFLAKAIASEGAVVFNVGVRTENPFPAIEQVACSVRFARATAADHGGDATHITLVGHSGGAATGMVVALTGDEYARGCVATEATAEVDALVGYEAPFDWATQDYQKVNFTVLEETDPDQWEAINPYSHVGGNPDLVVRLIHGDDYSAFAWYEVPRAVSVEFHEVLLDTGYDTALILLEDADHGALLQEGSEVVEVAVEQALLAAHS